LAKTIFTKNDVMFNDVTGGSNFTYTCNCIFDTDHKKNLSRTENVTITEGNVKKVF